MSQPSLKGKVVIDWLEKWNDLPSLTLARMIYNSDNNKTLYKNIDEVRGIIRYYKGTSGSHNREKIKTKNFLK